MPMYKKLSEWLLDNIKFITYAGLLWGRGKLFMLCWFLAMRVCRATGAAAHYSISGISRSTMRPLKSPFWQSTSIRAMSRYQTTTRKGRMFSDWSRMWAQSACIMPILKKFLSIGWMQFVISTRQGMPQWHWILRAWKKSRHMTCHLLTLFVRARPNLASMTMIKWAKVVRTLLLQGRAHYLEDLVSVKVVC